MAEKSKAVKLKSKTNTLLKRARSLLLQKDVNIKATDDRVIREALKKYCEG